MDPKLIGKRRFIIMLMAVTFIPVVEFIGGGWSVEGIGGMVGVVTAYMGFDARAKQAEKKAGA